MTRIIVRSAAEADISEAALWYEDRAVGLGAEFLRAADAAIVGLRRMPERFPRVYGDVRRVLVRRFPYAFYFVPSGDAVVVIACMHVRRDPRRWKQRADG
jgi:plasmid stabilization system protein ParE